MDDTNNEFSLIEIENQNMNTSLDLFEIIKETAEEYCLYFKKYKEITEIYFDRLSKLTFSKIETKVKNKNINISPFISILNKVPQLIEQQINGLKNFVNSFQLLIKQLEDVLKNELNSLEGPKNCFDESKKNYLKYKTKNKKLMDTLSSLEKKMIKYHLNKKDKNKDVKDLKEKLNIKINEAKNIEKDYLNINKKDEDENYHKIFQDESIKNINLIKARIRTIIENLNNTIIFFLSFFNECFAPAVSFIQKEKENNDKNPIDVQDLINNNMTIKIYKLEELPSDKYNIKLLDKSDLEKMSFSIDELNEKDIKRIKTLNKSKNFDNNDIDDIMSKFTKIDIFEIVKELYSNFKMINKNKNKYDIDAEEVKIEVKNLSDKLLLMEKYKKKQNIYEEKISDKEKEKLFELIRKKENRIIFLRRLNKIRTYGVFEYKKSDFDDIIKIFLTILDDIQNEKDTYSFQFCIILSQTFYYIENENKKYLFRFIKSHPIFSSEEMWKNCVNYFIENEVDKYNQIKNNLIDNMANNKINDLIFAQLVANTNNMIEFDFDANIAENIIMENINKYNLNEKFKTIILNIINNKKNNCIDEKININEKENNKINENNNNDIDNKNDKEK